ncbi:MAG TPA: hypothetical protein VMZ66_06255 [Aeromicrobium sp.]|nr:hypothetical protein [Aeromicrobium sp.]
MDPSDSVRQQAALAVLELSSSLVPVRNVGYLDYCRQRARDTLAGMTEDKAATPLPPSHRYRGQPYAWVITSLVGHTTEHGSQIRQYLTAAGIARGTQV